MSDTKTSPKTKRYQVVVDQSKCISAASCVAVAAKTFALDQQQLAVITDPNGDDDDTQLLAAQSCPTGAITVIDTQTGQQIWPLPAKK